MKRALLIAAVVLTIGQVAWTSADEADSGLKPDDLFKKLDANHDGTLTRGEIPPEHQKFFDRLLRVANAEKAGQLTREQFETALKQKEEPVVDIGKAGNLGLGMAARGKFDGKRIFNNLDRNKDGKLTRDEAEGRPRILSLFDRLGKDELTLDDLSNLGGGGKKPGGKAGKKGKKAVAGESTPAHNSSPLFKLLDTNHDGRLSKEEFAKASAVFEQLDRNQDGFLDHRELMGLASPSEKEEMRAESPADSRPMRKGNGRVAGRLMQLVRNADTDGDGKISMDEAPPQLKRNFARIDTNGDGTLDMEEIAAWAKTRAKKGAAAKSTE